MPHCSSRRSARRPVARSGLRRICLLSVARSQRALPSRRRRRNSARHSHARGHRPLRLSRCPSARRTTRHSCRPVSAQESRQTDEARPPRAQARRGGTIAAHGARGCFKDGACSRCEKKGAQGGGLGACGAAEGATKGPTSKRTQTPASTCDLAAPGTSGKGFDRDILVLVKFQTACDRQLSQTETLEYVLACHVGRRG